MLADHGGGSWRSSVVLLNLVDNARLHYTDRNNFVDLGGTVGGLGIIRESSSAAHRFYCLQKLSPSASRWWWWGVVVVVVGWGGGVGGMQTR